MIQYATRPLSLRPMEDFDIPRPSRGGERPETARQGANQTEPSQVRPATLAFAELGARVPRYYTPRAGSQIGLKFAGAHKRRAGQGSTEPGRETLNCRAPLEAKPVRHMDYSVAVGDGKIACN